MGKVNIISTSLVPMATNANSMSRIELTPWELQFLLLDPIQKGILFRNPQSQYPNQLDLIHHLKHTLSRALDFFPPLAGRLGTVVNNENNTTCFFVDCNNAGAEFTHAVARDFSVSDILEAKYIPEIVSSFFPLNGLANCEGVSNPLLGAQVTELADGYFISCTANHVVMDGASFWHFFNSWSEISRGFDRISKVPVFQRRVPGIDNDVPIHIPTLERNLLRNSSPSPPLLERVFCFSKENVAKLKARANHESGSDKISSLQALSAHLWRSVTRCRRICRGDHKNSKNSSLMSSQEVVSIYLLIGARARVPLPEGYFGNAVYVVGAEIGEEELLQNSLGHAAMKINELVARQSGETARKFVEDWVKSPEVFRRGGKNFVISSSPRFDVYGNDFGWGRPIGVRSGKGQKADGKMTVFAAVDGGIDVEVCLAPETMKALEDDAVFNEYITA